MKPTPFVLMAILGGSSLFAADSASPAFTSEPLSFVPTPMSESSPAELLTLQEARMFGRKTTAQLPPARPRILLESRPAEARMPIIEPNPEIQFSMPIVTPDPAVDYKLRILEASPSDSDVSDENAK